MLKLVAKIIALLAAQFLILSSFLLHIRMFLLKFGYTYTKGYYFYQTQSFTWHLIYYYKNVTTVATSYFDNMKVQN